ncbi:Rha family transcriptional regulator [Enterobacter asburiae]|uniref:Rha family phage regulatory protein n=1 Tax=Enterobacter asburiae TaxID=61645 RepID=UPI002FF6CACA
MMNAVLENKNGWNYSSPAVAKSTAGIGLLFIVSVPEHAPKACFLLPVALYSMVAQAGASHEAPGSDTTGKTNPVWATTNQIGLCCGSDIVIVSEAVVMTTIPAFLHPEVTIANGRAVTTTIAVASFFQKEHKDVLRKISALDCSPDFTQRNFTLSEYTDSTGRTLPMYEMTKDGFVFLVMGFTGKRAAAFKEAYISEFNRLEAELSKSLTPAAPVTPAFPAETDFSYLAVVERGQVVNIRIVMPGQMLLCYSDFIEMAQRTGCVVIDEADLRSLSSEAIISLCENAKRTRAKWEKIHSF